MTDTMRKFETGATRDLDHDKLDYEGFLSPLAIEAFAIYMHACRKQADGSLRASDNWQKGMPLDVYMKSAWRHFHDLWAAHRQTDRLRSQYDAVEALCGLLFNIQGYLHTILAADDRRLTGFRSHIEEAREHELAERRRKAQPQDTAGFTAAHMMEERCATRPPTAGDVLSLAERIYGEKRARSGWMAEWWQLPAVIQEAWVRVAGERLSTQIEADLRKRTGHRPE